MSYINKMFVITLGSQVCRNCSPHAVIGRANPAARHRQGLALARTDRLRDD